MNHQAKNTRLSPGKSLLLFVLFLAISMLSVHAQEYHILDDFELAESDDFPGWTVGGQGVAATASGVEGKGAKFRGMSSWLERNSSYSFANELVFSLRISKGQTDYEGAVFKVYKSTDDGASWDSIWSVTQASLRISGTLIDEVISINSLEEAVKLKFVSIIPGGTERGEYPFTLDNVSLSKQVIPDNNTDVALIEASSLTVSYENMRFTQTGPAVFTAHDSISFGEDQVELIATALHENASVSFGRQANPQPGQSDTAVFTVTAADGMISKEYQAIISRSLYQSKTGFLTSGGGSSAVPGGWSYGGGIYASSSKGDGGAFPGTNGMRLFKNSKDELGMITTPLFSSVSTLTFASKFSLSDDESLRVMKSTDDGTSWEEVKTYTPAGGEIPSYPTEQASDTLAVQTLEINEENVMLSFLYEGSSNLPRLMLDDIACKSTYDPDAAFDVKIRVYDIEHRPLEGAAVMLNGNELLTGSDGFAEFEAMSVGYNLPYTVSKDGSTMSGELTISSTISMSITLVTEQIDIFLALGQSNMAGRGEINEYVDHVLDNVSLMNDEAVWIPAKNPMNLYSNIRHEVDRQRVGPSWSFSRTLSAYLDQRIAMVVNARGGSNINEFLSGPHHESIMERINETKIYGQIKGVIWHQGESNSSKADLYMGKLSTMVDDLRSEIGAEVYFVAGQMGPWNAEGTDIAKYGVINDTIAKIANYITNTDYVTSEGLTDIGDYSHFNTESQILLGQRYAKKILNELYGIQISLIVLSMEGEGYIVYKTDTITMANDYSYTSLSSKNAIFSVCASPGKEFVELVVNGAALEAAVGDSIYAYSVSADEDRVLNITMTIKDQDHSTSGIELNEEEPFFIYPNPAKDKIFLSGSEDKFEVLIFDNTGRMLRQEENKREIELHSISPGSYILMCRSKLFQKTQILFIK